MATATKKSADKDETKAPPKKKPSLEKDPIAQAEADFSTIRVDDLVVAELSRFSQAMGISPDVGDQASRVSAAFRKALSSIFESRPEEE